MGLSDDPSLPPARLRYRVSESPYASDFLRVGEQSLLNLERCLRAVGKSFESFDKVLDFGCGCGRTLLAAAKRYPGKRLHGSDTDAEAIRWCSEHLDFAAFATNGPLPPAPYTASSFDLIYAISVFTHLSPEFQARWLREFKRLLRPNGLLLLTVHGRRVWSTLPARDREAIERNGCLFATSGKLSGICPSWYHTAYHKREYVEAMVGAELQVLAYIEEGMGYQDAIIAAGA